MKSLRPTQRRELRARAHGLNPVAMISEAGLSAGVLAEIERGLKVHELIKIRVFGADRDQRDVLLSEICTHTGAQAVQHIGKILVIYRENPPEAPRRRDATAEPCSARPGPKRPRTPKPASRRAPPESLAHSSSLPRRGNAVARPLQRRTRTTRARRVR